MIKDAFTEIQLALTLQNVIDSPDYFYNGESELTDKLITYLKEYNIEIPKLPDDINRRKDVVKLMVRLWANIEALNTVKDLMEV